jgi:hypothetical protein
MTLSPLRSLGVVAQSAFPIEIRHPQTLKLILWVSFLAFGLWEELNSARDFAELHRNLGVVRRDRPWWSPRGSLFLILAGAGYFVFDCWTNPPFGASRSSLLLSWGMMALGFLSRTWE